MEEPDLVVLHYQMLEYLFRKCKLSSSCFNHTWQSFLKEYPEYQNSLTESELKDIFWTQIAPNIEQYALLTEEQTEYFYHDGSILDLSDENLTRTLENNEPRKESDYFCWKSEKQAKIPRGTVVTDRKIQNIFDEPNITERNGRIKLNIIELKPPSEQNAKKFSIKSLEAIFLTESDQLPNVGELSCAEITNRLKNAQITADPEHLGMFSDGLLLQCMANESPSNLDDNNISSMPNSQILPFPSDLRMSQSGESFITSTDSSTSILAVPNITRTPTRSVTRSLSQTTPTSINRRSALQKSKSMTPSRITRSRKALVPDPAMNLKMSKFMGMHVKRNK